MPVAETTAVAVVAFNATNIDDIVALSVLFARRDECFRTRHILAGQYLGFAVLVAASLATAASLLALPDEAVGALGLIPIALGDRIARPEEARERPVKPTVEARDRDRPEVGRAAIPLPL